MDFTDVYKQSSGLCAFSPDGRHLATAVQYRLVVRDAETLQIVHLFTCTDLVQAVEWSADSRLLLCASFKLGAVNVWSLEDASWCAKIDEGAAGLTAVRFSPDGRHVLCFSDFQLRVTIWSLVNREAVYIQYPKHNDKAIQWRGDHRYMALVERKDCKDSVSIYDCHDWTLVKNFHVETTDLEDLAWSPDGRFIAVWDAVVDYRILIYTPDGRRTASFSAYQTGLGIKTVTWSPSAQFLAIGSYDQKVRILNHYTWQPIVEFNHTPTIAHDEKKVYQEVDAQTEGGRMYPRLVDGPRLKMSYAEATLPFNVHSVKPDPEKPNPRLGVGILEFNIDGKLLLTRNDNMPNTLWIWDVADLELVAVINQNSPVRSAKWHPLRPGRLALCTATGCVYLWDLVEGCSSVEVPAVNFSVNAFRWNPDGRSLALLDKDTFCVAFLVEA